MVEKEDIWVISGCAEYVLGSLPTKDYYQVLKNHHGRNMNDTISDMLVRIKNAGYAGKKTVVFSYSKIKFEIAKLLFEKKFVGEVLKKGKKYIKLIEITLLYDEFEKPRVSDFKRISKLSRRIYSGVKEIHRVKNGFGLGVYSTVKGIISDKEARSLKVGGEFLFEIW